MPVEYGRLLWPAVYLPLLLWVALTLMRVARRHGGVPSRTVTVGLAGLATAVMLEMLAGVLIEGAGIATTAWPIVAEITCEEAAELAGWMLIASGLAAMLLGRTGRTGDSPRTSAG